MQRKKNYFLFVVIFIMGSTVLFSCSVNSNKDNKPDTGENSNADSTEGEGESEGEGEGEGEGENTEDSGGEDNSNSDSGPASEDAQTVTDSGETDAAGDTDAGVAEPSDVGAEDVAEDDVSVSDVQPDADSASTDAEQPNDCSGALPLVCGDNLSNSTITQGRANQWRGYGCSQRLESGREVIYEFQTDISGRVTIKLEALSADLDLFIANACNSWDMQICSSTPFDIANNETITFNAEAGERYEVIVDGYDGAEGDYTLSVDCTGAAADDCSEALPLSCGDNLSHSTVTEGRADQWYGYSCTQRLESGRETIYKFSTDTAKHVTVMLKALNTDLDLFMTQICDSWRSEICSSTPFDIANYEEISFDAAAGEEYFVIVDGYADSESDYTLMVNCATNH